MTIIIIQSIHYLLELFFCDKTFESFMCKSLSCKRIYDEPTSGIFPDIIWAKINETMNVKIKQSAKRYRVRQKTILCLIIM